MRKIMCAAALCGVVAMSGCNGNMPFVSEKLPDMDRSFSSSAEMTIGKTTAQAEIDRISPGCWEFTFTAPDELAGVVMTIQDGKLTASLGELTVDDQGSDHTALPLIIAECIDGLSSVDASEFTESGGVLSVRQEVLGSPCTVTIDKASGEILSFKSHSNKLAVYFSDISPYTAEAAAE